MQLGTKLGLGLGNTVLDGDPAPTPKKRHSPQFLAHVRCGQMARLIKLQLAMETGLGTSDFVLDKDPVPLKKGAQPEFLPMSVVAKHLDAPGYHLVRG